MTAREIIEQQPRQDVRPRLLLMAERILYQLNRIFLRHGVLVPELKKILEWTAARAVMEEDEFKVQGRNEHAQSFSRGAVLTGLTRIGVKQALEHESAPVTIDGGNVHRLIRILTAWQTEPGYQDENGSPVNLPVRGPKPSLQQLCIKYGRDTTARAVADVLVENGNAEWDNPGQPQKRGIRLRFVQSIAAAKAFRENDIMAMTQIGSDFAHSYQQAFDNAVEQQPRFIEVYCNDIDPLKADEAFAFLRQEIEASSERCRVGLQKYRVGENEQGIRMGIGAYSFRDAALLVNPESEPENASS